LWVGAILVGGAIYWYWSGFGGRHSDVSAVALTAGVLSSSGESPTHPPPKPVTPPSNSSSAPSFDSLLAFGNSLSKNANAQGITFSVGIIDNSVDVSGLAEDDATRDKISSDLQAAFGVKPHGLFGRLPGGIDSLCWAIYSGAVIDSLKKGLKVRLEVDKAQPFIKCVIK
jgi:hypothetical protein